MASIPLNEISWTEIPCTDLARAQSFYSAVFGWTCTPTSEAMTSAGVAPPMVLFSYGSMRGSFVHVEKDNFLSPAIHPDNEAKARFALRVTVSVASVDETLKEVEKAGGRVYLAKKELPNNMGCTAYFVDSEGNVMGLWSMK